MDYYADLLEAINGLKARGYTHDFNLEKDRIICSEPAVHSFPHEFEVDEYHRFEGMSNPDDNSIIYAITTARGEKGILISAYGVYTEDMTQPMLEKLTIRNTGR